MKVGWKRAEEDKLKRVMNEGGKRRVCGGFEEKGCGVNEGRRKKRSEEGVGIVDKGNAMEEREPLRSRGREQERGGGDGGIGCGNGELVRRRVRSSHPKEYSIL